MKLFDYNYTLDAGESFFLEDIIGEETYQRLFSYKYISFLNKGQCGNGGTTGFVQYALKNNKGCLILVPNRSIVVSKEEEYKNNKEVCCVYGGSGSFDRDTRIVIATYDQFPRLLSTLSQGGFTQTEDPWESEFWSGRSIIIDEYHKLVDESGFRDTCHKVTELIKNTDAGVVLMSATPHWGYIEFIRELVENRDIITYNINYNQAPGKTIQIYDIKKKDLPSILKKVKDNSDQTCVFYNSVEGIKKIIDNIGDDDSEVLCSEKNEKELGEYFSRSFNEQKRFHLMTSAFFTGQDIRAHVKQCIIIGSREFENMCLGERDIKQMMGRFRKGVDGIHIFYLSGKTQMDKYQSIEDEYKKSCGILELIGDKWTTKPVSIQLKQENIRLRDTLERFGYWSSKKALIKRLTDYGYEVKEKRIGEFEGLEKRRKLSFREAQQMIAEGKSISYDDYKYGVQIQEYMKEKGVEEMLNSSRETIIDWYKIRKNVGISDIDLLTPEEKFKVLGLEHFGRYKASFLMSCLKYLGVSCEYDQLSLKMRETMGCFVAKWKADPKGKAAGDIHIVFMKMKEWEAPTRKGSKKYKGDFDTIPEMEGIPHMLSYQTRIENKKCKGKTISLKDAPLQYKSLKNIPLYRWVNEDKAHRLPEIKSGKEWRGIKMYRQTKISEMFRDTDIEYPHNKSQMEYIDCLIIDIDEGITFQDFKERYQDYVWVAYPTINNIPDDWNKFRVIVPLKKRLKLCGEYNVMTLKMLRSLFCYYEDPNHQVASFINQEDWQQRKGNDGKLYDIPQGVVDDIMLSIKNSKELVLMRFDRGQADKNVEAFHWSSKTLEWAQDYFRASFDLGDGERHKRLFVIKNNLTDKDRELFQYWLMREYPQKYTDKWKSHKIVKRS